MKSRLYALTIALFFSIPLGHAQPSDFYPLESLKPGQKGYGKTIFQGVAVERFDVEILGVLRNVGPKQNLILARLSGDRLLQTGVFAGMSGSPVYIEDRLAGAVAYAFPFSKEPLAGITPIQEIVDIFKEKAQPVVTVATAGAAARSGAVRLGRIREWRPLDFLPALQPTLIQANLPHIPALGREGMRAISIPLNLAGFSAQTVDYFMPQLRALGLSPVQGLGSAMLAPYPNATLEPGSTISVQLTRGDMDVSASGTVTYLSGEKIYAFGHPFLSIGYTDLPLSKAAVLTVIPSVMSSEKISAATELIGSIKQDRATGILGVKGEQPKLIPVHLRLLTSRNELKEFKYEVITDNFLTPFLMALTVHNSIVSSERSIGGQTLQVRCTIAVKGQPDVNFENNVSSLASTPVFAAQAVSSPVNFLLNSGFENLEMQKINLEIAAFEQTREAALEKVWQDKLEARAGEEVVLTVFLRKANGDMVAERYPIRIPEDMRPGLLKIHVGDGLSLIEADERAEMGSFMPESLNQLIKAINNIKKNDRLYIRLFREEPGAVVGGEGLPGLPPSLIALYGSDKTSGDVKTVRQVIYLEHELPATEFVLKGQKLIQLKVKS